MPRIRVPRRTQLLPPYAKLRMRRPHPIVCAKPFRIRDAGKKGKNADSALLSRAMRLCDLTWLLRPVALLERSVAGRLLSAVRHSERCGTRCVWRLRFKIGERFRVSHRRVALRV